MPSPEASRRNLAYAIRTGAPKRSRSDRESHTIKLLIWQSVYVSGRRVSQRVMAAQLGVSQPYVHKVLRKAHSDGWDALMREGREVVTFSTLEDARRFTERLRTAEPELLAPIRHDRDSAAEPHAMTVDESIAARWRDIAYERRNALSRERRHATFSVRVR